VISVGTLTHEKMNPLVKTADVSKWRNLLKCRASRMAIVCIERNRRQKNRKYENDKKKSVGESISKLQIDVVYYMFE
jgi:hypothetical protein